MSLMLLKMLR